MNRKDITCIALAIIAGIAFGLCHVSSVLQHRSGAQVDTFSEVVTNTPKTEIEAENKRIEKTEPIFAKEEIDVIRKYDDGIPQEVKNAAEKYGEEYNICPELIEALAYQESRFKADVVSADGVHIGICQINPNCHSKRMQKLGVTDLTDIDGNIEVACDYLAEIFTEYEGDPDIVLMIYNGDYSWKSGHISNYANEILERSAELERLHGK